MEKTNQLALIENAKKSFELAVKDANAIAIVQNAGAAFTAVMVVKTLRETLTKEVMEAVFMPLMNTKIGFLTDRNGRPNSKGEVKKPYEMEVVRDAIIDAVSLGILPTGNQFNIISEKMYPTKEGYTALLNKANVKFWLTIGIDKGTQATFAEIPVRIDYEFNGEKKALNITTMVKKDNYSSSDQLRGKAERKAKKQLYEYITGCDFGDADENSSTIDVSHTEVKQNEVETRVLKHIEKSKTLEQLSQVEKECITPTLTDLYEKRKAEISGKLPV